MKSDVIGISYPEPDKKLTSGKIKDLLAYMGPGIILAAGTIGNGEVFFSSRGGAIYGYILIWTYLLTAIMKGIIVYTGAKYIVLTGEHPFARFGQIMPGPKNWLAVFLGAIAVIAFPAWSSGFMNVLAQWASWVFGIDVSYKKIIATVFAVIIFALLFISSYDRIESIITVIVFTMIVFSFIAVIAVKPEWLEVLKGTFIPTMPGNYADWIVSKYPDIASTPPLVELASYLGALGGGTYDYIGYVGTLREKTWGILGNPNCERIQARLKQLDKNEQIPLPTDEGNLFRAKSWLKATKMDDMISFIAVFIIGTVFMILGNVVLGTYGLQLVPNDNEIIQYQANFFASISPILVNFYKIAIGFTFFGALVSLVTTVYPSTFRESFGPTFTALSKPENYGKVRISICTYSLIGGLLLIWSGFSYTKVVSFASIMGGVFSLGVWGLAMLWTEKKALPQEYRFGKTMNIIIFIFSLIMFLLGLYSLLQFIGLM